MLCKNENEWRRGLIVPEDDYYDSREVKEERRDDLITIHIYKDQIVKTTEDIIRWTFRKIKSLFRKKKKEHKPTERSDASHSKEKNQ